LSRPVTFAIRVMPIEDKCGVKRARVSRGEQRR
jgi:hypothetical protein